MDSASADISKNKIMRNLVLLFSAVIIFNSCHKNAPSNSLREFSDNFESYHSTSEMVGPADNQWTEFNVNETNVSTDTISIDTVIVHSGRQSVRFHCVQNDPAMTDVCKCNLNKGNLFFKQGETVYYSCWYYLQRNDMNYGTFFVWDLGQIVHGSLEIRVMAWEQNLELERGKIGLSNIFQKSPATLFPINRWTHLELEIKLSQYDRGSVKMWLDGNEIINKDKVRTMPKDIANLIWDTKGYYERVQVGITAKNGTQDLILYADDMDIKVK